MRLIELLNGIAKNTEDSTISSGYGYLTASSTKFFFPIFQIDKIEIDMPSF